MRKMFIALALLAFGTCQADEEKTHDITFELQMHCPESEELAQFLQSIPSSGSHTMSFEEWKSAVITNMTCLIELIESEQVYTSHWSVNATEHAPDPSEKEQASH